jgi:hypothetical protein
MAKSPGTSAHVYEIEPMFRDDVRTRFKDHMMPGAVVIPDAAWQAAINFRARQKVQEYFHARVVESFGKELTVEGDSRTIVHAGRHELLTVHYTNERFYGNVRVHLSPARSWGAGRKLPSREFAFTSIITKGVLADMTAGKVSVLEIKGPWDGAWQAIQKAIQSRQAQVAEEEQHQTARATEQALREAAEAPVHDAWKRVAGVSMDGDAPRSYNTRVETSGHGGSYTFGVVMGQGSRPLGPTLLRELAHRLERMGNAQIELDVRGLTADQATYLLEALPQADEEPAAK